MYAIICCLRDASILYCLTKINDISKVFIGDSETMVGEVMGCFLSKKSVSWENHSISRLKGALKHLARNA